MSGKVLAFPKRTKRVRKSQMRDALEQLSEERSSVLAVEHARSLLAEAKDLGDVADMRDKAAAMAHYARARSAGSDAHADAWEIMQLATRRIGELTRALPKSKGGRPSETSPPSGPVSKGEAAAAIGLSKQQVSRAEQLAALPEPEFKARVEAGRVRLTKQAEPDTILATSAAAGYDGDEYGTPENWLEPGRELLGGFDFDPASNAAANNIVRARHFCTKADSSLERPWKYRTLWCNWPFSSGLIERFAVKHVTEWKAKHFKAALVLTNCDSSTGWYKTVLTACSAFLVPDDRIPFLLNGVPIKQNRYTQTLFYFGKDLDGFARLYGHLGTVCVRYEARP